MIRRGAGLVASIGLNVALYVSATAAYITLGVFETAFLLTWPVGAAFLIGWVWGLPALARRLL